MLVIQVFYNYDHSATTDTLDLMCNTTTKFNDSGLSKFPKGMVSELQ